MAQEKIFENKIKKFLDKEKCWYVKFFANGYTKKGIPDLLCCVNGYFLAIEVKAENGKATDLQKWNIEKIKQAGGRAMILKPSMFEEFRKLIAELKGV
jgi:Holliday junction resolvase